MKKVHVEEIVEVKWINEQVFKMIVNKPKNDIVIRGGQFYNIKCSKNDFPLLRRPISVSSVMEKTLEFIIRVEGEGTKQLSKFKKGDFLNFMGPLGNGVKLVKEKSLIVGGGIGVAPLKEVASQLEKCEKILLGFRDEPYEIDEYRKINKKIQIASENSKEYYKGYVTDLLDKELSKNTYSMVYACGPEVMLKKVAEICKANGVKVQLLMEERMACGIGACLVCTCKVKNDNTIVNAKTCKDGPVFYGEEVYFNEH